MILLVMATKIEDKKRVGYFTPSIVYVVALMRFACCFVKWDMLATFGYVFVLEINRDVAIFAVIVFAV